MDGDETLFPGLDVDDLAVAGGLVLPPVAGGAPSILDTFSDSWEWVSTDVVGPIGDFLGDVGEAILNACVTAVSGVLGVAGWWMYKWLDAALGDPEDIGWRTPFPHPDVMRGADPWLLWEKVFEMVSEGLSQRLPELGEWIVDQLGEGIEVVGGAVGDVAGVLDGLLDEMFEQLELVIEEVAYQVWQTIRYAIWEGFEAFPALVDWIVGQLAGLFGDITDLVWDGAGWLWEQVDAGQGLLETAVSGAAGWLWEKTAGLIGAIPGGFVDLVGWLGGQFVDVLEAIGDLSLEGVGWLWDQISAGFEEVESAVSGAVIGGAQAIGNLIREAFEWVVNTAFEPFIGVVKTKLAIPGKLIRAEYRSLDELLSDMLDPPDEVLRGFTGMLMLPFIVVGLLVNVVTGLSGPLLEPVLQEQARNVGARIPTYQTLRGGYLRGLMSEGVHDDWLGRSGYEQANIELQKELYKEIPTATDLIQMVVKEAFNEAAIAQFGLDQEFPSVFADWMAKQGYTQQWARRYWIQHWQLPSPGQVFEMLHRELLNVDEVDAYLKVADYSPPWRQRLRDISYNPLARVDVRRMYAAGKIDKDKVLEVNKALGYTPEDAEALTEWVVTAYPRGTDDPTSDFRNLTLSTIKDALGRRVISRDEALERVQELDYTADDAELLVSLWELKWAEDADSRSDVAPKTLTRSIIETAYQRRLITFNAGITELTEVGYTPEDARLLLELVDLRLEEQVADLEVDVVLNDYDAGMITEAEMAARLGALNLPQDRVDFLVRREITRRQGKTRRLTLSQLEKALQTEQISEGQFRVRLDRMGYNAADVDILVVQAGGSLTIGQLQSAYRQGTLTEPQLRGRLADLGVERRDIDLLIPVAVRRPTVAQLQEAYRRGELVEATFRTRLAEQGVERRDIDLLVAITPRLPSLSELRKAFDSGILTETQLRARFEELGYAPADVELLVRLTLEAD